MKSRDTYFRLGHMIISSISFGFRLFRNDSDGKNEGLAVFVPEDLMATRKENLEISSVEALRLEISLPKSRGFLGGTLYRPDCSAKYYDEDFMAKLNIMLDTTVTEGKELILFVDYVNIT